MAETLLAICKVFYKPAEAIADAMKKKRWLVGLCIILVSNVIFFFLLYPSLKVKMMDQGISDEMLDLFEQMKSLVIIILPSLIILELLIASFFIYLFFKIAGSEGLFVHFFSGVVFASLIDWVIGRSLKPLSLLIKRNLLDWANLSILFPDAPASGFLRAVASQVDFFTIWYLTALALGIAHFARISRRKSLSIIFLYFLFKVLTLSPLNYLLHRLFS